MFLRFKIYLCVIAMAIPLIPTLLYSQNNKSSSNEQIKIRFSPQWTPQSQFAGYYAAKELGFYDEAGLDVEIIHPSSSVGALPLLKDKQSDIIGLDLIAAIYENMNGESLCNILQSSQTSSLVIISHNPISKIKDLSGKKIGRWNVGFSLVPLSATHDLNTQVEWINIWGGVNFFLSKAVDANLMMTYNELLNVKHTGYEINPNQLIYFRDFEQYNIPEDGIYTTSEFAKSYPHAVDGFREASIKGWLWVRENQEEALDMVMKMIQNENIPSNRVHQKMMLEEILTLQLNKSGERSMVLDQSDFERAKKLLIKNNVNANLVNYESFVK
ncbi:MAG: ABC transporter substrate-binding protein [Rikenellaceae bacterium]